MTKDQWRAGMDALAAGNKREARRVFRAIIQERPNDPDAWWRLALATDELEQKAQCLRQVLRLEPGRADVRELLAKIQREVVKPTPTEGIRRPVLDTHHDGDDLIVEQESTLPQPAPRTQAPQANRPFLWVVGLVAILLIAVMVGLISYILVRRLSGGPAAISTPATALTISVAGCVTGGGPMGRLIFVNTTSMTVQVAQGSAGSETFLFSLSPGAQHSLDVAPASSIRYSVQADPPAAASGGAIISVPAGSVCNVSIR